jgi:hypothetical protein
LDQARFPSETLNSFFIGLSSAKLKVMKRTFLALFVASLVVSSVSSISYAEAPNYRRHIVQENGESVYVVTSRAPHLFMISRDLYGEVGSWKEIAKWNGLKFPYELSLGQHLILKKPPILSAEQGDHLLMKSWAGMKRWDVVSGIKGTGSGTSPASVSESKTSVKADATVKADAHSEIVITSRAAGVDDKATAEPDETPAPVVAEVKTLVAEKTGVPVEVKAATPALPPPAPFAVELTGTPESKPAKVEVASAPVVVAAAATTSARAESTASTSKIAMPAVKPSPWIFQIGAAASAFRLENKNTANSVSNTLNSDIDYGVELEAAHPLTAEMEIYFQALIEHMDIRPADGLEIEGESQYMMRFAIGVERELSHHSSVHAAIAYEQLPFVTPTATGVDIEAIFIPQITAGTNLGLLSRGNFNSWFTLDGILLLPRSQDDHDVKSGEGFSVGLKFQNKLSSDFLTYGVAYRYLQQNTSDSENNQKAILGNLGVRF